MSTRLEILRLLADGALHSGADIGRALGISRAAVSKAVRALRANGLVVEAIAGVGYRLDAAVTPLDRHWILCGVSAERRTMLRVEVREQVDSTNRHLLDKALAVGDPTGMVCLTETQPGGRGRQGKSWLATPYANLMMSMAWRSPAGPALVAGLSLAAGVAVARALERYGVRDVGLKWPNDVLWQERKLAGLLVDMHGEASGPCTIVIGVGVNCRIAAAEARHIDQPWVDLQTITGETPDRNRLAALLIDELQDMCATFATHGLAAFAAEWSRRHVYNERAVTVSRDDGAVEGIVDGIDVTGALRLRTARGETRLFHAGEVSVRTLR